MLRRLLVISLLFLAPVQAFAATSASPTPTTTVASPLPTNSASATPSPSATPTVSNSPEVIFSDINSSYWAYDAIQDVVKRKIVNGYSDGSFGPDKPLTRAETTKVITLATTSYRPSTESGSIAPFGDVDNKDTLLPFIQYAYSHKMIKGYNDRTFRPTKSVSRAEFLKIFIIASNNQLQDYNIGEAFLDVSPNHELAPYIYSARALGYINGTSNGLFSPDAPITRAEAVKILDKYLIDKDTDFPAVTDLEKSMLDAINQKRTENHEAPLVLDQTLSGIARKQSQELYDQWHFLDKDQKKQYEASHANLAEQDKRRPWTSHRNASGQTFDQWFALASKNTM